jgi:hypothetical protein
MLTKKCFSDLACEYSDLIYDEFLEKVYGLNQCTSEDFYDDKDDYKLQLEFLKAGYRSAEDLEDYSIDIDILGSIRGIGNIINIFNNTYITNNYTNIEATGYVHIQAAASTVWTIINPLGFCPNVTIVDQNEQRISGQVNYDTTCTVITITFNAPFSGKAFLS